MKKTHSKKITTKTCLDYVSGPVKIKDALYMGDELAAKVLDNPHKGSRLHQQQ